MSAFLLKAYESDAPAVKEAIAGYLESAPVRLKDIADGSLTGRLTGAEVLNALKEEKTNLKNEALSIGLIVGADLEELVQNTIDIFTGSLMDGLYYVARP